MYETQEILISKIKYVEKRIKNLKSLEKDCTGEDAKAHYWDKIESYRKLLFLFKNIGDSLAFIFIDRHDFKPLSYNGTPDFITGKSGFKKEKKY